MSNYNMKQWVADLIGNHPKKPMPILSFPSVGLLGVSVKEIISNSTLQARGMQAVAENTPAAASVSFMEQMIQEYAREYRKTVIMITHNARQAEELCDRIVHLHGASTGGVC